MLQPVRKSFLELFKCTQLVHVFSLFLLKNSSHLRDLFSKEACYMLKSVSLGISFIWEHPGFIGNAL